MLKRLFASWSKRTLPRLTAAVVFSLGVVPAVPEVHEVVRVIDGDTVIVRLGTDLERVRLVGVDSPETYPKSRTEPYGPEATAFMTELLAGAYVSLDLADTPRDRYGRLLATVYLQDGRDAGLLLLQAGLAEPFMTDRPEYSAASLGARSVAKGLWKGTAFRDVNCSAFAYQDYAQAFYDGASTLSRPDPYRLDPDRDSVPCETLLPAPVPYNALPLASPFQS